MTIAVIRVLYVLYPVSVHIENISSARCQQLDTDNTYYVNLTIEGSIDVIRSIDGVVVLGYIVGSVSQLAKWIRRE